MHPRFLPVPLLLAGVLAASAASPARFASAPTPELPPPATGSGSSGAARFAGSPGLVLFLSDAPDLVANDANGILPDLFLRDVASGTTRLVATRPDGTGGNGATVAYDVAADGSRVAFASEAGDLVPDDANGGADVFVRDLPSGAVRLVSATPDGAPGNGASSEPVISGDGRWVLFESAATNLTSAPDTNGVVDVFLRDVASGTTEWISVAPDGSAGTGTSRSALLAARGEVIVFRSESTNLATIPAGQIATDLHVRRRSSGTTVRVALPGPAPAGTTLPVHARNVVSDPTGRYLAFGTDAGPGGVWWIDLAQGPAVLASGARWVEIGDDTSGPSMTADGRTIAFASRADRSGTAIASVWNADTGLHVLSDLVLTDPPSFPDPTNVAGPVLSPDGKRIAFVTDGAMPAAGVAEAGRSRLYVRTLATGATVAAPLSGDVVAGDASVEFSADGSQVVFGAAGKVDGVEDRNRSHDVLVAPATMGSATLVSARLGTLPLASASGPSWTGPGSLSDDGRWLVFTSMAGDVLPGADDGMTDVFLRDLAGGGIRRVAVAEDGQVYRGASALPRISADGSRVAFVSEAALVAGDTNRFPDVYVRDVAAGTTVLASARDGSDVPAWASANHPAISADGGAVLFEGRSSDWTGSVSVQGSLFRRDLATRRTTRVLDLARLGGLWVASRDLGSVATWTERAPVALGLYTQASAGPVTVATGFTPGVVGLSADGGRMAYVAALPDGTGRAVQWRDNVSGKTTVILAVGAGDLVRDLVVSGDGSRVAFATTAAIPGGAAANGNRQVLVHDVASGTTRLASHAPDGSPGEGPSDSPAIDATGSRVVFRSAAPNLVAGAGGGSPGVLAFDVASGTVSALAPGLPGAARPAISADGRWVTFMSGGPAAGPGDLNEVPDVLFAPALAAPVVRVEAATVDGAGTLVLRFATESGWTYRVERAPSLDPAGFVAAGDAIAGNGGVAEARVASDAAAGFVRVVARR